MSARIIVAAIKKRMIKRQQMARIGPLAAKPDLLNNNAK
jgi:hypothetical protein